MAKRYIALCLTVFVLFIAIAANAQEKSLKRTISERFIGKIDSSTLIPDSFKASPDGRRVVYGAKSGGKRFVVGDGVEGKQYDGIVVGKISFDNPTALHYLAFKGNSVYLVEEKIE